MPLHSSYTVVPGKDPRVYSAYLDSNGLMYPSQASSWYIECSVTERGKINMTYQPREEYLSIDDIRQKDASKGFIVEWTLVPTSWPILLDSTCPKNWTKLLVVKMHDMLIESPLIVDHFHRYEMATSWPWSWSWSWGASLNPQIRLELFLITQWSATKSSTSLSPYISRVKEAFNTIPLSLSNSSFPHYMTFQLYHMASVTGSAADVLEASDHSHLAWEPEPILKLAGLSDLIRRFVDEVRRYKLGFLQPIWQWVFWSARGDYVQGMLGRIIEGLTWFENEVPIRFLTDRYGKRGEGNISKQLPSAQTFTIPEIASTSGAHQHIPQYESSRHPPSDSAPDGMSESTHQDDSTPRTSFEVFNSAQDVTFTSSQMNQAGRDQTFHRQIISKTTHFNFPSLPYSIISSVLFDSVLWKQPTIVLSFGTEVLRKLLAMLQEASGFIQPALAAAAAAAVAAILYERSAVSMGQYMLIE